MKRMQLKHWQDPVATLLGAWFAVSPWILGIEASSARAVCVALGLVLMLTGISAMRKASGWEYWVVGPTGFAAFLSPWMFGFADESLARGNAMVTGLAAIVLAAWVLSAESTAAYWRRDRMAR